MEIKIMESKIEIKKTDELYTILKLKNEYQLFVKYNDEDINYYIKDFDDLFECMQFIEKGVLKVV